MYPGLLLDISLYLELIYETQADFLFLVNLILINMSDSDQYIKGKHEFTKRAIKSELEE